MGQAVKPHDRLTGGTLVALSKAAFPPSDGIINVDFIQALIGVCQRIFDHYFLHISGHKAASLNEEILVNNRHKFISLMDDGAEDSTRLNHAAALLAQLDTRHSPVDFDDVYATSDINADQCRQAFKSIFEAMGQAQHYNMMAPEEAPNKTKVRFSRSS